MSSIIVLDSSDEDESPPKKANLKSPSDNSMPISASKNNNSKQRILPSGITITPRHSPITQSAKTSTNSTMQSLMSPLLAANINHAIVNIINNDRQTPTPPKTGVNLPAQTQRKRKTPTPPQAAPRLAPKSFASMSASNIISPAAAATTIAPLPPIMPMITAVHSMAAAGATPPLQLMATPPHNVGNFAGLNEQIMMNPHLLHPNLPPNTTITAHPNSNPNQNNINNNFKIHLPPKPSMTPSPVASPAHSATSPQLTANKGLIDRSSKRVKPTTILKSTDDAWLQQRPKLMVQSEEPYHGAHSTNNRDLSWEVASASPESSKSSSRQQTPMASPSTPKVHRSPDLVMSKQKSTAVFDLTCSPEKPSTPTVITLDDTPCKTQANAPHEKHMNGGDRTSKSKCSIDGNEKPVKTPESIEADKVKSSPKPPLEPEYEELIKVCRKADPSDDMNKLIKTKLIKYYYEVHGDFVKSKSFRKNIRKVVEAIKSEPELVYYNLKNVVEELKVRRKAKIVDVPATLIANNEVTEASTATETEMTSPVVTVEDSKASTSAPVPSDTISAFPTTSTGNKKLDEQIKKLNKALYVLTKRIEVLEQSEVDWDDDDSSFLQVERFKKRACQIYEKICDLTGESKNAHRLVKKPIKFNETRIPQFNKTLQAFINRTKEFPDYFDVLRMLEHCNRTYNLGLVNFEIKNIAEDAFIKVGKLLQSRRKADLYETVTHYGGRNRDPAQSDPILAAKLNENQKNYKKISDILEKYARKQDMPDEEEEENKAENTEISNEGEAGARKGSEEETKPTVPKKEINDNEIYAVSQDKDVENVTINKADDEDSDDDVDDDEDDDEEDTNIEEHVETLANGDLSDNESDNEIIGVSTKEESNKDPSASDVHKELMEMHSSSSTEIAVDVPEFPIFVNICDNSQVLTINCTGNNITNTKTVNNNNIESPETKTVLNDNAKDCKTPPPNGKLKEPTKLNICNSNPATTSPFIVTANAATTTTTTTADLKIVAVSSHITENVAPLNSSDYATTLTAQSANKSLEEIVISDEES